MALQPVIRVLSFVGLPLIWTSHLELQHIWDQGAHEISEAEEINFHLLPGSAFRLRMTSSAVLVLPKKAAVFAPGNSYPFVTSHFSPLCETRTRTACIEKEGMKRSCRILILD